MNAAELVRRARRDVVRPGVLSPRGERCMREARDAARRELDPEDPMAIYVEASYLHWVMFALKGKAVQAVIELQALAARACEDWWVRYTTLLSVLMCACATGQGIAARAAAGEILELASAAPEEDAQFAEGAADIVLEWIALLDEPERVTVVNGVQRE